MVLADELLLKVKADTAAAQGQMTALARTTDAAANSMVTSFAKVAAAAGKVLTGGVVLAAIGGVKAFANFDEAMTNSLAIMTDVTDEQRKQMEGVARDIAKTTTISATEAAEAYFYLASAGMDAAQSMAALPAVAAFAQAGNFDMSTATDLATDALSAMGMASDDAEENLANLVNMTDVLIRANTLANASAEQFSTALVTKSAAAAKTLGMSLEETTAILAVMADAGIKGTNAGTQLAMTLNNLTSNAVKNKDEFEKLGVTVFDASGQMLPMSEIVGSLTTAMAGMTDEQKVAAIAALGFGDKAAGLVKTLLGTEDAIAAYQSELEDASGYTDSVAAKQLEAFTAQWDLLKSKFIDIGITIGSVIVPKLVELMDTVGPYVDRVAEWIEQNDQLAVTLGGIVGAIWPVMKIVSLLTNPIGIIIAAIGGLVWWLGQMGIGWDDVKAAMQPIIDTVQTVIKWFQAFLETGDPLNDYLADLPSVFKDVVVAVMELWDTLKEGIEDVWNTIEPIITDIVNFITEEVGELIEWWTDIWPMIQEVVGKVLGILWELWQKVWGTIERHIENVWNAIKNIVSGAMDVVQGIIQTVLAIITGDWSKAWDGIKQIFEGLWNVLKGVVQAAWEGLTVLWEGIINALWLAWETLWLTLGSAIEAAWGGIVGALKAVVNALLGVLEGGINMALKALQSAVDAADVLAGPFINFPDAMFTPVSIPRLAEGGMTTKSGPVRVGERGIEIVNLPAGAAVTPLQGSNAGGGDNVFHIHGGGDPKAISQEVGWEFTKRGIA